MTDNTDHPDLDKLMDENRHLKEVVEQEREAEKAKAEGRPVKRKSNTATDKDHPNLAALMAQKPDLAEAVKKEREQAKSMGASGSDLENSENAILASLMPCGCGGEPKSTPRTNKYRNMFQIKCDECGLETPKKDKLNQAVDCWNAAMHRRPGRPKAQENLIDPADLNRLRKTRDKLHVAMEEVVAILDLYPECRDLLVRCRELIGVSPDTVEVISIASEEEGGEEAPAVTPEEETPLSAASTADIEPIFEEED